MIHYHVSLCETQAFRGMDWVITTGLESYAGHWGHVPGTGVASGGLGSMNCLGVMCRGPGVSSSCLEPY